VEIPQPLLPREVDLKEPYWYVVSDKNIDEFLERVSKEQSGQVVFFAMSVQDYELMAYNMQELRRYIRELKEVVVYYRNVTTEKE
jgi:type II secretory pathway component GspD/PulD (secretin)